jgi:hypothetical protein
MKSNKRGMRKGIVFLLLLIPFLVHSSYALTNVTGCGTYTSSDTYEMTQNIDTTSEGTCIVLQNHNITFDCKGYSITYVGIHNAISSNNYDNLTIKNCNLIQNNTDSDWIVGIYSYNGDNITLFNNNVTTLKGALGFNVGNLNNGNLSYNTFNIGTDNHAGFDEKAIGVSTADNLVIHNNIINSDSGNVQGFEVDDLTNSNISYNTINSVNGNGIYFLSHNPTYNNVISNNYINNTAGISIYLRGFFSLTSYDNVLVENNFIVNNGQQEFSAWGDYFNNTNFKDQNIKGYWITDVLISFENSTYGLINYTQPISSGGLLLNLIGQANSDIVISDNYVWVNGSITGFNKPANVTLYNVNASQRGFIDPVILKDGVYCDDCVLYSDFDTETDILFSVTGFSSYEVGDNFTTIEMTVYSPTNTTYQSTTATANVDVEVSANKTADIYWYELNDSGVNVTFTPNTTVTVDEGQHKLVIWVNDSYGNEDTLTVYFTYEQVVTAPTGAFGFDVVGAAEDFRSVILVLIPLIFVFIVIGLYKGWFGGFGLKHFRQDKK